MAWSKKVLKTPDVEEFFKSAVDIPAVEGLRVGVFGPTGIGKTHFALTAPRPTFVIDTEFGTSLVVNNPEENIKEPERIYVMEALRLKEEDGNIDVDPIGSLEDVEEALKAVLKYIADHKEERGTVVIDSASDIWAWMGMWLEEEAATVFTKTGKMLRTEWGKANKRYMKLIWRLLRSKWNVILTGKDNPVFDSEGKPTAVTVPRWQKDTVFWLDLVFRGVPDIKGHGRWTVVKCRAWGGLKGEIVDLTWEKLIEFLRRNGVRI